MNRARFRRNVSISIAGLVAFLGAVPLATSGFGTGEAGRPWYAYALLLILLIPIAVAVWGWRSGTDADAEGLRLRALFGSRPLAWSEISAFVPQGRRVAAALIDGRAIVLPAVTRDDLPRLIAASGQPLGGTQSEADPEAPGDADPANIGLANNGPDNTDSDSAGSAADQ